MGRNTIPFLQMLEVCKGKDLSILRMIGNFDERILTLMKEDINKGRKHPYMICATQDSQIHHHTIRNTINIFFIREDDDGATCTVYGLDHRNRLYTIEIDRRRDYIRPKVVISLWDESKLIIH